MAKNSVNWNILIVGGVIVGGLYFWNKIKNTGMATDYTSGLTGETISDAGQGTIRTDLRQYGRTQRALGRQAVSINRQDEMTARTELRQEGATARTDIRQSNRTDRVALRQSGAVSSARALSGGGVTVTPAALANPTTASTIQTARQIVNTPSMGGGKISRVKITGTTTTTYVKRPVINLAPIRKVFKRK